MKCCSERDACCCVRGLFLNSLVTRKIMLAPKLRISLSFSFSELSYLESKDTSARCNTRSRTCERATEQCYSALKMGKLTYCDTGWGTLLLIVSMLDDSSLQGSERNKSVRWVREQEYHRHHCCEKWSTTLLSNLENVGSLPLQVNVGHLVIQPTLNQITVFKS